MNPIDIRASPCPAQSDSACKIWAPYVAPFRSLGLPQ